MTVAALAAGATLLTACGGGTSAAERGDEEADALFAKQVATDSGLSVTSPNVAEGDELPVRFTCDSTGISPALDLGGIPEGTVELALVVDDPDAEAGTFVHWIVAGLAPQDVRLAEDALPEGATQARNSAGRTAYSPACPPEGDPAHTYRITVYALDEAIGEDIENDDPSDALDTIAQHATARATLTATYARPA